MKNKTKTEKQEAELQMSSLAARNRICYVTIDAEHIEGAIELYGKKLNLTDEQKYDLACNASCNLYERIVEAIQDELEGGMYDEQE